MTEVLRSAETVMKLRRLGSFHQTRLSFVRSLMRRMMGEAWVIQRSRWNLDKNGFGTAIYTIRPNETERYSVIFFANQLDDEKRTDRVIAEQWDVALALCEGDLSEAEIETLRQQLPKQEAGRCPAKVLVLSRANKSVRNFNAVVNSLASGVQPHPKKLAEVGYLYRTTAVYGNGKFGVADFAKVQQSTAFDATFRAQMLTVFMVRHFSLEQAEYIAQQVGGIKAVSLRDDIKRYLGVGNATGLGMAPFLVQHPQLLHRWVWVRETALGRVLTEGRIDDGVHARWRLLLARAQQHVRETATIHPQQQAANKQLVQDLDELQQVDFANWSELMKKSAEFHLETQELVVSILLELYPDLVDELAEQMNTNEQFTLQPSMQIGRFLSLIEDHYAWALAIDFDQRHENHFFWYRSAEKEEPRLGNRFEEPGANQEQALDIGRSVHRCYRLAQQVDPQTTVIDFLLAHPEQRGIVRRIQTLADFPYAEIQDNLLAADCLPIDMLRCKLSFFGAGKFDPRSNLWVRITLFQGAPLVCDIGKPFADDWCWPVMPLTEAQPL